MRLNSVRLQNFRQHVDTAVTFDAGLTGIIGANGSGKTTILEAIAWALYGNPAARGTRESIRFARAGARAAVRVELDFELSGHRYRVVRGLTSAELYLDGAAQPIASSITGVTELLQRRLGMTRSEFFNTYFTGQKELNVMAAMGPSERAQFLSRVLGYERLRTAQNLVRERRKLIVAEIAGLRSGMPDPDAVSRQLADAGTRLRLALERADDTERRRAETAAALAELAPRWESMQRARERLAELLGELKVAEGEETNLARDAERVSRELAELGAAREELARLEKEIAPLPTLTTELKHLDRLCGEEGRRQTLAEAERTLRDELGKLRERLTKIETAPRLEQETAAELDTKRRQLEEVTTTLEARRTEWVRDRQEAETKREALRRQYAEHKEQRDRLVALGETGPCPVCTRPLGTNYRTVLDGFDEQLETIAVDGKFYASRLEQLKDMPEDVAALEEQRKTLTADATALERKLARVQSAVAELAQLGRDVAQKEQRLAGHVRDLAAIPPGYDGKRHDVLRREIERLTPLATRVQRLGALAERAPKLEQERARVATALEESRVRLGALRDRRTAIDFREPDYAVLRTEHERLSTAARAAELTAVGALGDAEAARAAMESAEAAQRRLAEQQARMDALQKDKRLHDELDRAYTDLRTDLNFQLRPELSELASAFITELTDARYSELELDDQYCITVLEEGIPKPVISGGEEDLANLVLRLAISQMIAERAGQSFSLLILDEVFGSLDESRRHNVVELLRRLHDRFEQVILITHIEGVREGLDRVVMVRYDEETGASVVTTEEGEAPPVDAYDESLADVGAA
jgi:exonuclease SbcC